MTFPFTRGCTLKKVKLFPTATQQHVLASWFRAVETTYLATIDYLKGLQERNRAIPPTKHLTRIVMAQTKYQSHCRLTPLQIKAHAIRQALSDGTCAGGFDAVTQVTWPASMIMIDPQNWSPKCHTPFPSTFGRDPLETETPLPRKINRPVFLHRSLQQEYFLMYEERYNHIDRDAIAFDVGVRTPLVGFSMSKKGRAEMETWTASRPSPSSTLVQVESADVIGDELRREEVMDRILAWLNAHYRTVVYPEGTNFFKMTYFIMEDGVRSKLIQFHHEFRQRLVEETSCQVVWVNESYTTKTCSNCGHVNHNFRNMKMFTCDYCGSEMDRDVNAAKNILLRYLR